MNRMTGIILAVVGVILAILAVIPTNLMGRLNGVGGSGHYTADAVLALGVVLLIVGIFGMMRSKSA